MLGKPQLFYSSEMKRFKRKIILQVASHRPLLLTTKCLYNFSKLFYVDIQILNFINRIQHIKIPVGYADIALPPAGLLHLKHSPVHTQEKLLKSQQHHMRQTHASLQTCSLQYQQLYGKKKAKQKGTFHNKVSKKPHVNN